MIQSSLSEILDFAVSLSLEAGRFILPLWKKVAVDHKADGSEVTEADRGAERLLRKRIVERYPDHAILGEEFGGEQKQDTEHLWLLDPVDGTSSFGYATATARIYQRFDCPDIPLDREKLLLCGHRSLH